MKTKILGTGLSGLVGSRIVELLSDRFEFQDLSLATGIDITNEDQLKDKFLQSEAKVVLHMAAKTDVDQCEDDKLLRSDGAAWQVNVVGTENIVDWAKKTGKRVVYISTDFVFDGTRDFYDEKDKPNPVNWYGYTKYLGEKALLNSVVNYAILRLAYPFRARFDEKKDFVRTSIDKLSKEGKIYGLDDHIFTPTFIDDIAYALKTVLEKELVGIFHVVGSTSLTPLKAIDKIKKVFGLSGKIEPINRETYFKHRAYRPFKLRLRNDKITHLGIHMRGFEKGLVEMRRQL